MIESIAWNHPEYGPLHAEPCVPEDPFDVNHYELLVPLVNRRWALVNAGKQYPKMRYCRLVQDDTKDDWFRGFPAVWMRVPPDTNWAGMDMLLKKNCCETLLTDDGTAVVSPFCEWGMAEFWEQDLYHK